MTRWVELLPCTSMTTSFVPKLPTDIIATPFLKSKKFVVRYRSPALITTFPGLDHCCLAIEPSGGFLSKEDFKNDPLIKKALEIFKGTIVEVRA